MAIHCRDHLHVALAEEVTRQSVNQVQGHVNDGEHAHEMLWGDCIKNTFLRMDCEVGSGASNSANALSPSSGSVGSTAIIAVLSSHHIIVGNCGDSRAVLCRRRQAIPLSEDHKVSLIVLSPSPSLSLSHTHKRAHKHTHTHIIM